MAVGQAVLRAGVLLEQDESLAAGCRFRGDEIQFVANDRLRAPVGPQTTDALRSPLAAFGRRLFGGQSSDQVTESDEADRIRLTLHATTSQTLGTLLQNIS